MKKQRKRTITEPDALVSWRTWLDHQYDVGYWPSTGRVPPTWHIFYGCLFVVMASLLIVAALIGLLSNTNSDQALGGLVIGGLLLAWAVRLLRKAQLRRSVSPRYRRRQRH